jgi:hypothetical protein
VPYDPPMDRRNFPILYNYRFRHAHARADIDRGVALFTRIVSVF